MIVESVVLSALYPNQPAVEHRLDVAAAKQRFTVSEPSSPNNPLETAPSGLVRVAEFTEKLRRLRDALAEGLVERDVAIRLGLLAALAGEHVLMLGPPGTGKSLVARRLHLAFAKSRYFERLLTRFTVPEELFGPLSIKGLEADRYERLTEGYLPTASVAFLDEVFKANSAILNALLTLLNEREFDNGTQRLKTPLVAVIGASNELPEGDELDALSDRFLVRLDVGPVSADGFRELLDLRGELRPEIRDDLRLTDSDLLALRDAAETVELADDLHALLCELREWCMAENIPVSDRRWRKIVKLLQVSAATNGRTEASIWDGWLIQHCLGDTPEVRNRMYQWYLERVGAARSMNPERLTKLVVALEARLKLNKESRSQARTARGEHLYKSADGSPTVLARERGPSFRGSKPLYLAPDKVIDRSGIRPDRTNGGKGYTADEIDVMQVIRYGSCIPFREATDREAYLADPNNYLIADQELPPFLEPTRYGADYIALRLREVESARTDAVDYLAKIRTHRDSLEADIRGHLWVMPDFSGPALDSLDRTRSDVERLIARLDKLRREFAALPAEVDSTTSVQPLTLARETSPDSKSPEAKR